MPLLGGGSASSSANMSYNSRNMKSPFLTNRCLYWGVDLPVHLPIWAITVEMWNCHSWPLDASMGGDLPADLSIWAITVAMWNHHSWPIDASTGGRSASSSANMSYNSRNLKLPFVTNRCLYCRVDLPVHLLIWATTVEISNCHSWPIDASTGGRSASSSANMSYNSRNVKLPFLTNRCLYGGRCANMSFNSKNLKLSFLTTKCLYGGRSASSSANMSYNSRNVKMPFLTNRCLYCRVDLPLSAITVKI